MENDFHQLTHSDPLGPPPTSGVIVGSTSSSSIGGSHPNGGSSSSNNEADDFVRLDPFQVQDHGDDLLMPMDKDPFAASSNNFSTVHSSSTDRPLVTFDDPAPPSAPSAPPSLSPVHEAVHFEEAELDRDDSPPAYEARNNKDNTTSSSSDFLYYEPDSTSKKGVASTYDFGDVDSLSDSKHSGSPATRQLDDDDDDEEDEEEEDDDDVQDVLSSTPGTKTIEPPPVMTTKTVEEPSESIEEPVKFIASTEVEPKVKAVPTTTYQSDDKDKPVAKAGCSCPFSAWFNPQNLDPRVVELVYWRDPKKTGIVFGGILVVLLSLTYFSLISVIAYLSLAVLTGTISFRIYKNVMAAVQKSNEGHPFKQYLEQDMAVSQDQIHEIAETVVTHSNAVVHELRRVILVEDLIDSIKFGVMLWCLTYVGAWFNGLTLMILAFVGAFTLPKVYENNKTQIDHYVGIVNAQVNDIMSKVKAKVPIGKKDKEQ